LLKDLSPRSGPRCFTGAEDFATGIDRAGSAVPTGGNTRTAGVELGKTLQLRFLKLMRFPEEH
jgi:hypothetical protein